MRASIIISSAFAAVAFAQDPSSVSVSTDDFAQTSLLTQTNSFGVVTGQPTVAGANTNQPAVQTSQPTLATDVGIAASIPAVGTTGIHTVTIGRSDNTTQTLTVSANNSTTVVVTPTLSGSGSGSGSRTTGTGASGSGAESTGAAATMRAVAGSLVGAGAFVAAFL